MPISDEHMLDSLKEAREYAVVILREGPHANAEDARAIVWEHGRRNFELRQGGVLNVVLPIRDDRPIAGLCIFDCTAEEAGAIMLGDPAVQAGIFVYDVYTARGFPGDALQPNDRVGTPPTRE